MNLRQINLNSNAGAFVDILATLPVRKFDFMEDESGATQGLQVKSLLDKFATTNVFSFNDEPLAIPDAQRYPALGPILGMNSMGQAGAFNFRAADKLISVRSNGAAGTILRFTEYE
jgi:hypothetical protein